MMPLTRSAWPVPTLERTYPGHLDQGRQVRAALRSFLHDCPVADEVTAVAWELAANACLYSNSSRPGGEFAMTVHDFTGDYVYAEVRDQGSTWDADLGHAECPTACTSYSRWPPPTVQPAAAEVG